MALPPLLLAKGTTDASRGLQKALTGDIYSKHWTEVVGKGKKAKLVEHEVHVNPVGIGLGVVALGAATLAVGVALWVGQMRIVPTKVYQYHTIVDVPEVPEVPAIWNWVTVDDEWVEPLVVQDVFLGVRCNLDGAENTLANPAKNSRNWYGYHRPHGLTTLYGTRTLAGYWKTHREYKITVPAIPAVPAVTHDEKIVDRDGYPVSTKKFSIEERRGFSMADVVEGAKDAIGVGSPWFGSWAHGQWQAGKKKLW